MPIGIGSPVRLSSDRVSMKGGVAREMTTNLKGRVCRMTGLGTCWVQFEQVGCRRVHVNSLVQATEPAPNCSAGCRDGSA